MPLYILALAIGILLGGVTNWLADQLPLLHPEELEPGDDSADQAETDDTAFALKSLGWPVCVKCGKRRGAAALLGLTAWLTGNRACATCGNKLSIRHPVIELLTALILSYLLYRFGPTYSLYVLSAYLVLFELIAVIDIEHRYILNIVMLPAFVAALIEVAAGGRIKMSAGLIGYAVGQLVLLVVYLFGWLYLAAVNRRRQEPVTEVAFGFGDVTLATFCGLVVGFPNVLYMLLLMVIIGGFLALVFALVQMVRSGKHVAHMPVAYGPAIVLAATITLVWPPQLPAWAR